MRKFLAAVICFSLVTAAYAQKTKTQMNNEVNTNFPDNTTGLITPALLRATVLDIIQSYVDLNGVNNFACPAGTSFMSSVTLNAFTCTQNNAFSHLSYQTGYVTNIASMNKFTGFAKVVSQSTVDSLTGSAPGYGCFVNQPIISLVECGTSNVCTTPVATIGTVTVTQQAQLAQGTITNPTVTAGDYVAWIVGFTVGTGGCNNTSLIGQAGLHAN